MNADILDMTRRVSAADIIAFLSRSSCFSCLPPPLLKRLIVPILEISSYETGQYIVRKGDRQVNVHMVYQGRVHGTRVTEEDREHHFFIHEGEMFGELALHSGFGNSSNLRAAIPTTCLTLELETLKVAMSSDWRLAKAIFSVIGQRLAERFAPPKIDRYPWSDVLRVNLAKIDAQHERLFTLINRLGEALSRSQTTETTMDVTTEETIRELLLYIDTHFHDEEVLMQELAVPWLEEHKRIHRRLEDGIIDFKRKIQQSEHDENQLFLTYQLHKFMGDLMVGHILEEDMKLKSWPSQLRGGDLPG
ncbi:MAG: cyclic nucleotide-binding domain-containing protein [Magnetococcales bacterium]|nr:cyclic nucleotide-binding domain-containing protein [Magnetococcales bacterium]